MKIKSPIIRRVWVDSGPAGTRDPGARIIVLVAEGWYNRMGPAQLPASGVRTSVAMNDTMRMDLPPPPIGMKSYIDGFEGSDLVGVYYALDQLGEVDEGAQVVVLGDGRVFSFLRGEGKVAVRYAGKDWAPDMREKIREAASRFPRVEYRTVASPQNRAGHLAKRLKRRNEQSGDELFFD